MADESLPPSPVSSTCVICANWFNGCGSERASRSLRAKLKLLPVSIDRIQRNGPPDPVGRDTVVAKFIAEFRQVVYQEPCLGKNKRLAQKVGPVSRKAAKEQERRSALRSPLEELSKYYLRDAGAKEWEVAELLSKGKGVFDVFATLNLPTWLPVVEDLEANPTPNESAPGASTSTAATSEVPANLPFFNWMASIAAYQSAPAALMPKDVIRPISFVIDDHEGGRAEIQ